ncbi:hypothetical protein OK074_3021 [Actinobacteria bacterium OK074]|nr:hypothetical protein OK074_3021 [Actinobacteria bacterium OK074]
MVRGTTVRFVLTALAAVLLALQFLAPTASFAAAHKTQLSAAEHSTGFVSKRADDADEVVTCFDAGHIVGPNGPLRVGDRQRTAADSAPEQPTRVLLTIDGLSQPPAATQPAALRTARSSTAHRPAALQVFRC